MIEFKTGDIFAERVEALVNSVNCVGVMGRGIALEFKNRFPKNYQAYRAACQRGDVQPGNMFVYEFLEPSFAPAPRYIINFPTKRHWRSKSKLADIEAGLDALANEIREREIRSIAVPALATDLGGLSWTDVRPAMEAALGGLDSTNIYVFVPGSVESDGRANRSRSAPPLTPETAAAICLIDNYLRWADDHSATETDVQLLMYLLQTANLAQELQSSGTERGGLASATVKMLHSLRPHYLTFARRTDYHPTGSVQLIPGAASEAAQVVADADGMGAHVKEINRLIDGFESTYGLQLLTTVHSTANAGNPQAHWRKIVQAVIADPEGSRFNPEDVRLALKALRDHGFLPRQRRFKEVANGAVTARPIPFPEFTSSDPVPQEQLPAVAN